MRRLMRPGFFWMLAWWLCVYAMMIAAFIVVAMITERLR